MFVEYFPVEQLRPCKVTIIKLVGTGINNSLIKFKVPTEFYTYIYTQDQDFQVLNTHIFKLYTHKLHIWFIYSMFYKHLQILTLQVPDELGQEEKIKSGEFCLSTSFLSTILKRKLFQDCKTKGLVSPDQFGIKEVWLEMA